MSEAMQDGVTLDLVDVNELPAIPRRAIIVDASSPEVQNLGNVAIAALKDGVALRGKTLEVVFKKNIAAGLKTGTYELMKTTSGETLADAVDIGRSGRPVVGKGRLIESGAGKQLAAGAFQLLSIAVAQAHLAEINGYLKAISDSIDDLTSRLEDRYKGVKEGNIKYLRKQFLRLAKDNTSALPTFAIQEIESITRETLQGEQSLIREVKSLLRRVDGLSDKDKVGTEASYRTLRSMAEESTLLVRQYEDIARIEYVVNAIRAISAPLASITDVGIEHEKIGDEFAKLAETLRHKTGQIIQAKFTNSEEMLEFRREKVLGITDRAWRSYEEARQRSIAATQSLRDQLVALDADTGEVRLALAYDADGKLERAAIV